MIAFTDIQPLHPIDILIGWVGIFEISGQAVIVGNLCCFIFPTAASKSSQPIVFMHTKELHFFTYSEKNCILEFRGAVVCFFLTLRKLCYFRWFFCLKVTIRAVLFGSGMDRIQFGASKNKQKVYCCARRLRVETQVRPKSNQCLPGKYYCLYH